MRFAICASALSASVAFGGVYNNTPALPGTKVDAFPSTVPANQQVTATEFNNLKTNVNNLNLDSQTGKVFDARAFGAICDDSVDDTSALQAWLNAASAAGATAYLPKNPTACKITSGLTVVNASNFRIAGDGPQSAIDAQVGNGIGLFISGSHDFEISKIKIGGSSGIALKIAGVIGTQTNADVIGSFFTGATNVPSVNLTSGILLLETQGVRLLHNYLVGNGHDYGDGTGYGADIMSAGSSPGPLKDTEINGNFAKSTNVQINIGMFASSRHVIVHNMVGGAKVAHGSSSLNSGYGIMLYQTDGAVEAGKSVVSNNQVIGTQGTGIYLQGQPLATVQGNFIENVASVELDTSLLVAGIAVNAGQASILGNVINTSGKDGISIEGEGATIAGNYIAGATNNGIKVVLANSTTIHGNTVTASNNGLATFDFSSGTQANPIRDLSISGNVFFHNTVAGIALGNVSSFSIDGSNQLFANGNAGITITNSSDGVISGNNVRDNTTYGIVLSNSFHIHVGPNDSTSTPAWVASTSYKTPQMVVNGGNAYLLSNTLTTSCTSAGSGGPSGTLRGITDNTCSWDYAGPGGAQQYGFVETSNSDYNRFEANIAHGNTVADFNGVTGAHSTSSGNYLGVNSIVTLSGHDVTAGDDLFNQVRLRGNSTGNPVIAEAIGGNTDIGFQVVPKGAGDFTVYSNALSATLFDLNNLGSPTFRGATLQVGAGYANKAQLQGNSTGNAVVFGAVGTDTDIDEELDPQGAGKVRIPSQKSTTGTRYLCIDTNGKIASSASACSGT